MDAAAFRAQFPVLERRAYLNAGTDGPIPRAAARAAADALAAQVEDGRQLDHFGARRELAGDLRAGYAALLGCELGDLALTTSTSEGMAAVLNGLELGPDDEIVTSDGEHPGLIGPLIAARSRGARVRVVPLADVADAVGPATTLVAVSHVSWITGELAPAALAELDVPVLLDGAQGAGAVAIDVTALGCAAYAAAGQKWLCGADGTGMLYLEPSFAERVRDTRPGYMAFAEDSPHDMGGRFRAEAARLDALAQPREGLALSLASLELLTAAGWDAVVERATQLAEQLAQRLAAAGRTVAPRSRTTLVSWEDADPEAARERLAAAGVVVRDLPGTPYLRASVGAWNDESDLDRLLAAL